MIIIIIMTMVMMIMRLYLVHLFQHTCYDLIISINSDTISVGSLLVLALVLVLVLVITWHYR